MGKTAITSGGAGDIIFSIPILRALGVDRVIVKESFYPPGCGSLYSCIKPLLESQGLAVEPCADEGKGFDQFPVGVRYDINMDAWRACRMRGRWHIMTSMANHWRVRGCLPRVPWLNTNNWRVHLPNAMPAEPYTIWSLTPRWRENDLDWRTWYRSVPGVKLFVGFKDDYHAFVDIVEERVIYSRTPTFLDLAAMIWTSASVHCNQGVVLAIAQGIGKNYYCAFKRNKTNCRVYMPWEHAI